MKKQEKLTTRIFLSKEEIQAFRLLVTKVILPLSLANSDSSLRYQKNK